MFLLQYFWTHYKQSTHTEFRVAFNNVYRRILKLLPISCGSAMYANNNVDSFETLLRKRLFGFIERLEKKWEFHNECLTNS